MYVAISNGLRRRVFIDREYKTEVRVVLALWQSLFQGKRVQIKYLKIGRNVESRLGYTLFDQQIPSLSVTYLKNLLLLAIVVHEIDSLPRYHSCSLFRLRL